MWGSRRPQRSSDVRSSRGEQAAAVLSQHGSEAPAAGSSRTAPQRSSRPGEPMHGVRGQMSPGDGGYLQQGQGRAESITNGDTGEPVATCQESRETSRRRPHHLGPERFGVGGADVLS